MARPRILSVGQCGFDQRSLSRFLDQHFHAEVFPASTAAEAIDDLRSKPIDLILINRVLDVDGSSGLEVIRAIKADPALAAIPVMLVSNYAEAQQQAQKLGAVPGFGKAELHTAQSLEHVEQALGVRTTSSSC